MRELAEEQRFILEVAMYLLHLCRARGWKIVILAMEREGAILGGIDHFVYGDSARVSDNLALVPEAKVILRVLQTISA